MQRSKTSKELIDTVEDRPRRKIEEVEARLYEMIDRLQARLNERIDTTVRWVILFVASTWAALAALIVS